MAYAIIGGAVNLAARLESAAEPGTILIAHETSAAEPGTILIAHETWALVKDTVMAVEKPPVTVRGFAQPLHAYEVLGLREELPSEVIRREADGLRVMIDLSRSNRKAAVDMLQSLIGEINDGPSA
jgi:adenylate cyclase